MSETSAISSSNCALAQRFFNWWVATHYWVERLFDWVVALWAIFPFLFKKKKSLSIDIHIYFKQLINRIYWHNSVQWFQVFIYETWWDEAGSYFYCGETSSGHNPAIRKTMWVLTLQSQFRTTALASHQLPGQTGCVFVWAYPWLAVRGSGRSLPEPDALPAASWLAWPAPPALHLWSALSACRPTGTTSWFSGAFTRLTPGGRVTSPFFGQPSDVVVNI